MVMGQNVLTVATIDRYLFCFFKSKKERCILPVGEDPSSLHNIPFDAESTFVQSTILQNYLLIILTMSCWYSFESS